MGPRPGPDPPAANRPASRGPPPPPPAATRGNSPGGASRHIEHAALSASRQDAEALTRGTLDAMIARSTMCSALALLVSLATGCSTAYMPRPGPRVQVIMKSGTPSYARHGRVYEGGIFGGELEEAVRGNPEAESHSRSYRNGMTTGFILTLLGGASVIGGVGFVAAGTNGSGSNDTSKQTAGGTLLLAGLVADIVGIIVVATAEPHMWDAINVYNDGIPDFRYPARSPYAPPPYAPPPYVPAPPGSPPPPPPSPPPPPAPA